MTDVWIAVSRVRTVATVIDEADVPLLEGWSCLWLNKTTYANRARTPKFYVMAEKADGTRQYLHRLLMGLTDRAQQVDHIDGDPMNNRRANLRVVTAGQNSRGFRRRHPEDRARRAARRSRFRSVYWDFTQGRWVVRVLGRHFGSFADEDVAGRVAAEARARLMPDAPIR